MTFIGHFQLQPSCDSVIPCVTCSPNWMSSVSPVLHMARQQNSAYLFLKVRENSEMQCIYCWEGWILPPYIPPTFFSFFTLSFHPHPANSVNLYRCRSGAGSQFSLIPQSHLGVPSIGSVTPGFFLHSESCNKSKYRSAENTVKPGKHFINCYSLASGWLGGFSKWVKEFSHQGQESGAKW